MPARRTRALPLPAAPTQQATPGTLAALMAGAANLAAAFMDGADRRPRSGFGIAALMSHLGMVAFGNFLMLALLAVAGVA
jgi:hypothetical protein